MYDVLEGRMTTVNVLVDPWAALLDQECGL